MITQQFTRRRASLALLLLGSFLFTSPSSLFANEANEPRVIHPAPQSHSLPEVTVYKSPSCGCCQAWVEHMQAEGFTLAVNNVSDLRPYKQQAKLGYGMGSCHTAFVDGYALEGHVPAVDVKRLLSQRPTIDGLSVPGMPIGSPGMEVPGQGREAFEVISFLNGKKVGVFSQHESQPPE